MIFMDNPVVAVIMAGGRGERFWPLSTADNPKQFLTIFGEENLLQRTYNRVDEISFVDDIFIVAGESMKGQVNRSLPQLPDWALLLEPVGRNTAPCVAYSSYKIRECYGENTVIVTLPSDHHITPQSAFESSLNRAVEIAGEGEYLVTFGIIPDHPETGYGYIKVSKPLDEGEKAYKVEKFVEKPDRETAERYLRSGDYFWNSGMFIWRTDRIISSLEENMPELTEKIKPLIPHLTKDDEFEVLEEVFPHLPSTSIDYGVMEVDDRIALVKAEFEWDDLGSWDSLERIFEEDEEGNIKIGENIVLGSKGNIIVSEGISVATYGVEGLIVVATNSGVLVIPRGESQKVKDIVNAIKEDDDWAKKIL